MPSINPNVVGGQNFVYPKARLAGHLVSRLGHDGMPL
jgi:hypothetical protein